MNYSVNPIFYRRLEIKEFIASDKQAVREVTDRNAGLDWHGGSARRGRLCADRPARDLMVSEIILAEFRKIGVRVIAADPIQT